MFLIPKPLAAPTRALAMAAALALAGCAGVAPPAPAPAPAHDWANTQRYEAANRALGTPLAGQARVVFLGDSITDAWPEM